MMKKLIAAIALSFIVLGGAVAKSDPPVDDHVVVAGDSISLGAGTDGAWRDSYPTRMNNLLCGYGCSRIQVVGHGGQCLVATICGYGPNLLSTFQSEVINAHPEANVVLVEEGINDLSHVTDQQFKDAYLELKSKTLLAGKRFIVATITPTPASLAWHTIIEPQRLRINAWIRTTFEYIEFGLVLETGTGVMDPAYDSGDHIHPNSYGAMRMADVMIPLGLN